MKRPDDCACQTVVVSAPIRMPFRLNKNPRVRPVEPEQDVAPPHRVQSAVSEDSEFTLVDSDSIAGLDPKPSADADLWQEAIVKSRPILQLDIDLDVTDRASTLQAIFEEAVNRRDETQKSQRKFRRKSGRDVTYREVYGNIVACVQKFQTIGDIAIQADAGYASLPWAFVRVFITSAIGEHETYGSMLEGLELVANLIYHYAIIEQIYVEKDSQLVVKVRKSLVSLYIAILNYLVQALKYFGSSKAKRIFRGLNPTANTEVQKLLSTIDVAKNTVDADAAYVDGEMTTQGINLVVERQKHLEEQLIRTGIDQELQAQRVMEMMQEWQHPQAMMAERISDMHHKFEEDQLFQVLKWLTQVQHGTFHENVKSDRLESSGRWLLNSSSFRRWLTCKESSLVWMHGILGSGKTHLVSVVVDYLINAQKAKQAAQQIQPTQLAFFYCSSNKAGSDAPKDASRSEPVEVFRSIVKQLAQIQGRQDVDFAVKEKYRQLKPEVGEPRKLTMIECIDLITTLSRKDPTTIVIDALDELKLATRVSLIKGMEEIINNCPENTKVFLSTRHVPTIVKHLDSHPSFEITADKNGNDIRNFIATQLDRKIMSGEFLDGEVSDPLKADVQKALTERAGGMFWYASLQLNLLCDPERMWDEESVRESLSVLPASLRDLYINILF